MKSIIYSIFILSCCFLFSCASNKTPAASTEAAGTLNAYYRFQEAEKLFDAGTGANDEAQLRDAMNAYWIFICRNIPLNDGVEIKSEADLLKTNSADDPKVKSAKEKFLLCKKILQEKFNRKVDFKLTPIMIRQLSE